MSHAADEAISESNRERIAHDLFEIWGTVLVATPPKGVKDEHRWRFNWLANCVIGYCHTDLGTPHPSGEDASTWREDAKKVGLVFPTVDGKTPAERSKDAQQRALYELAMASKRAAPGEEPVG